MLVVFVTAPESAAPKIAHHVVEQRLAACVNIVPSVRSIYRFEGVVHDDAESLLIAKTAKSEFEALKDAIVKVHPYQLPEVIGLPVSDAHLPYRDWVLANSKGEGGISP